MARAPVSICQYCKSALVGRSRIVRNHGGHGVASTWIADHGFYPWITDLIRPYMDEA
jgi:hypothetical protein